MIIIIIIAAHSEGKLIPFKNIFKCYESQSLTK